MTSQARTKGLHLNDHQCLEIIALLKQFKPQFMWSIVHQIS